MTVEHSRPLKLAAGVSTKKRADLEVHLDRACVVLGIDLDVPCARLTAMVLLTSLRRGPGRLFLLADNLPRNLVSSFEEATAEIDPLRPLIILRKGDPQPEPAVMVHIGADAQRGYIRIVPEGYGAHVVSASNAVIRPRRPGNALGAVYCAALGAAEVFKRTALVLPSRRVIHRHLRFCPVTISSDLAAAPEAVDLSGLELTLAGLGAIGTGVALLLEALGADGLLVAVDRQRFARENIGTYSLGGVAAAESSIWKVDLAATLLRRFDVVPVHEPVDEFIRMVDRVEAPWTTTVLAALDSPEARRDVQRLWPDRLIDAATGDTMVGFCDHRHGVDPCLWCHYPIDRGSPSGADIVAERLGLSVQELADATAVLTEQHLEDKTEEQMALLAPHIGKPMCGLARATGLSRIGTDDYLPSVPFVSLQAACLAVGRLVAARQTTSQSSNFVQYDGLFGPQAATTERMRRKPDCICGSRAATIDEARRQRRRGGV